MTAFIPSTTTLLAASTQSRSRMRAANDDNYDEKPFRSYKELQAERQKRESMLTPEELARYKKELADFEQNPGYPEWMKDGGTRARFYTHEKDAIIGAFLGADVREHPDYQSNRVRRIRESMLTPEMRALYRKELADFERDPGYPEGMKDGESRARFCLREKDALIGAFLGADIREYPEYQSDRVRKIREKMLSPEELANYRQALTDFEQNPGYPEWMKDGSSLAHFYLREKDALIGSYLGSDIREYPDYQSKRYPTQEDKSGIKRR